MAIVDETAAGGNASRSATSACPSARTRAQLFDQVQAVDVPSRAQAVAKVKSGDVLAAVVIPPDIAARVASDTEAAQLEVLYNGDALEQSLVALHARLRARAGQPRLLRADPEGRRQRHRLAAAAVATSAASARPKI